MLDLDSMALDLSRRTHHRVADWQKALNSAIHAPEFSQMTDGEIEGLIEAIHSPDQLHWLGERFKNHNQGPDGTTSFDLLLRRVNSSRFSLRDWLEALHLVFVRAEGLGKSTEFSLLVGHVAAAAQTNAPESQSLAELVQEKFNESIYGGFG